jgi:hypothetical protein
MKFSLLSDRTPGGKVVGAGCAILGIVFWTLVSETDSIDEMPDGSVFYCIDLFTANDFDQRPFCQLSSIVRRSRIFNGVPYANVSSPGFRNKVSFHTYIVLWARCFD